jgi:hypothetical protein
MTLAEIVINVGSNGSPWDKWTAIGTLGLAATTVVLALSSAFWRGWTRPQLRMELDAKNPPNVDLVLAESRYPDPATGQAGETESGELYGGMELRRDSAWIRARVTARRSAAFEAEVVIVGAELTQGTARHLVPLEGMSLEWSGQPVSTTRLPIPRSAPRHVDIGKVVINHAKSDVPLILATAFKPYDQRHYIVGGGVLTVHLALASNNGPSTKYDLAIRFDGTWPKGAGIWDHLQVISLRRRHWWGLGPSR